MLTNARSLAPKIRSLHTMFEEHKIDIALISESWLKDGETLDRDIIDLEHGSNMKILYRNRSSKRNGMRRVGGGVSIVYNMSSCSFRERKLAGNKYEIVVATGKVGKIARQVTAICLYVEPTIKAQELDDLRSLISDQVLMSKASSDDPIIILGGDMNRRDLAPAFDDFHDICRANFDPTRRGACLDVLFTNANVLNTQVWPPLETDAGIKSDHECVIIKCREPRPRPFHYIMKTARRHTDKACAVFGQELRQTDWATLLPSTASPDELVNRLEGKLMEMVDRLFPAVTSRRRSNDKPWITNGIRRLAKKKAAKFKREGKSPGWWEMERKMQRLLFTSRSEFVARARKGGTSSRAYMNAVKALGTRASPSQWSVMDLFPGESPTEVGDKVVEYFTAITDEYDPLDPTYTPAALRRKPMTLWETRQVMKRAKKPNSSVIGDIPPRLMKMFHHELSVPAMHVFNGVFRTGTWPAKWKLETAVIIPKTNNPSTLSECRNISCTAFLSKVLESVLFQDIKAEVAPDGSQYGGVKNCSVNHLLVDLFDKVLGAVDKGDAAIVMGIDYQKAFNRLDHHECLIQLERLGASPTTVELVRAFLTNRRVQAKIEGQLSRPKGLNGGSPQGSILGCLLYCIATQQLDGSLLRTNTEIRDVVPPDRPPPAPPDPPGDVEMGENVGMGLLVGEVPGISLEVSLSSHSGASDDSFHTADGSLDDSTGEGTIDLVKYVDDTTTLEIVDGRSGIRHFSTARTTELLPAPLTEKLMKRIYERASEIGMVVNCGKIQLLVISPSNGCTSSTRIVVNGETICSVDEMKLLGFHISSELGVSLHIRNLRARFRGRFWSLIHLRRAGVNGVELFGLYTVFIRPIIEANSVVYHSQLSRSECRDIERLQKQVVKLCFGFTISYNEAATAYGFKTLEERREIAVEKFVKKALDTPRFRETWFVRRQAIDTDLRNRKPFVEKKARTARYYKSPLLYMQRVANCLMTA